jgi:uncharacterized protein (TIGR03503 family)
LRLRIELLKVKGLTVKVLFLICLLFIAEFLLLLPAAEAGGAKKEAAGPAVVRARPRKKPKKKAEDPKQMQEAFDNRVGEKSFSHSQFGAVEEEKKVDAVLLIDSSGSMKYTDPQRLRDQAARLFVRFLGQNDRVSIFQFDQEVKRLTEFTPVSVDTIKMIDEALQSVSDDGRFTDLELALSEALRVLQAESRSEAQRVVILLSDGVMDPHPDRGGAGELTEKLFSQLLEEYKRERISVFTIGLSPEADQAYLGNIARSTNALKFDAKNVQDVHKSFSDLYLSLKKPQLVAMEEGGFEIDPRVDEATFYITRSDSSKEVALISPTRERVTYLDFPPGSKWYRGESYDVVTLKRPTSGVWRVEGLEDPEGFATLITDMKLQVHLSRTNLKVGDTATVFARLLSEGKILNKEGLKQISAFRYKVASSSGEVVDQGNLLDDGTKGDEKAGDGIYSATIKAKEEGDFKLFAGVTSATFSRQQQVPFEVSRGAVVLKLQTADSFSGEKERFIVELTKEGQKLKELDVQLLAKDESSAKIAGFKLKPSSPGGAQYRFETSSLPAGKYSVTARVTGRYGKLGEVRKENSETIEYERLPDGKTGEGEPQIEFKDAEAEDVEQGSTEAGESSGWVGGLSATVIALIWAGGIFFFMTKKLDIGKNLPKKEKPYSRPESLVEQLTLLKEKSSERVRAPTATEYELFALVKESLPDPESLVASAEDTAQGEVVS